MLAGRKRGDDMLGMELVRRGDIDGVDVRVRAQLGDLAVDLALEVGLELGPRLGARVGGGNQGDPRIAHEGRQHDRECTPQTGDTDFKFWYHPGYLGG